MPWLLNGGKMVLHQPFSMPTFLQQIAVEQIEFTVAPPVTFTVIDSGKVAFRVTVPTLEFIAWAEAAEPATSANPRKIPHTFIIVLLIALLIP